MSDLHIIHVDLKGDLLHQPFPYAQSADPGPVGAGVWWLNTTLVEIPPGSGTFGYQLNFRNDANDGWVTI